MNLLPKVIFEKKEILWCTDVLYKYFQAGDPRYQEAKDKAIGSGLKRYIKVFLGEYIAVFICIGLFFASIAFISGSGMRPASGGLIEKAVILFVVFAFFGCIRILAGSFTFGGYRREVKGYFSTFEQLATQYPNWNDFASVWISREDPRFFREYYEILKKRDELVEKTHYFESGKSESRGNYLDEMKEGWWRYLDENGNLIKEGYYEDDAMIYGFTYDENRKPNGYWVE